MKAPDKEMGLVLKINNVHMGCNVILADSELEIDV